MSFMDYVGPFLLLLGVLVVVHELGHFAVAKLCGVKVERFAVGFGPSLLRRRVGETEYVLAWLPLGGYVKMAGESPDDELSPADHERSFMAQSPLRRTWIALAGPGMNVLLSIVVIAGLLLTGWPTATTLLGSIRPDSPAERAGLLAGDRIVGLEGREVWRWQDLTEAVRRSGGGSLAIEIDRDGERIQTSVVPERRTDGPGYLIGVEQRRLLAVVGVPDARSPAALAGVQTGDRVTAVDGETVADWYEFERRLRRAQGVLGLELTRRLDGADEVVRLEVAARGGTAWSPETLGTATLDAWVRAVEPASPARQAGILDGDLIVELAGEALLRYEDIAERARETGGLPLPLGLLRDGRRVDVELVPRIRRVERDETVEEVVVTGLHVSPPRGPGELREERIANPLTALWRGALRTWQIFALTVDGIRQLATREVGVESLAGPIGIGEIAGDSFAQEGWFQFLFTMCWISVNLAIVNLLPIPILDGGHIIFAAAEAVRGAPLSMRAREIAQTVGLSLIILLMGFAFWNDISRNWAGIVGFFQNLL